MIDAHKYFREQEEKEKVLLLRSMTSRGVFECKKALRNSRWDIEKARKWLCQFSDSYIFKERREIRK